MRMHQGDADLGILLFMPSVRVLIAGWDGHASRLASSHHAIPSTEYVPLCFGFALEIIHIS